MKYPYFKVKYPYVETLKQIFKCQLIKDENICKWKVLTQTFAENN